jgi:hypothetical protein
MITEHTDSQEGNECADIAGSPLKIIEDWFVLEFRNVLPLAEWILRLLLAGRP